MKRTNTDNKRRLLQGSCLAFALGLMASVGWANQVRCGDAGVTCLVEINRSTVYFNLK
jgi:hypothetical protein